MRDESVESLTAYLGTLPAVDSRIAHGLHERGRWWVKLEIDIEHPLAWRVVQELAHILNLHSVEERLPTVFKPVSPPPYLNGGPKEFLSWVIESHDENFSPTDAAEWLEGRLPRPASDPRAWELRDD